MDVCRGHANIQGMRVEWHSDVGTIRYQIQHPLIWYQCQYKSIRYQIQYFYIRSFGTKVNIAPLGTKFNMFTWPCHSRTECIGEVEFIEFWHCLDYSEPGTICGCSNGAKSCVITLCCCGNTYVHCTALYCVVSDCTGVNWNCAKGTPPVHL